MSNVLDFITRHLTDDDWMEDAACKGMTHLFFPTPAERPQTRERREDAAREICQSCQVKNSLFILIKRLI